VCRQRGFAALHTSRRPKEHASKNATLGTRAEGAPARFIRGEMLAFRRVTEAAF
jgi:hypothetical protein